MVKCLPEMGSHRVGHAWSNLAAATAAMRETRVWSLGWEDPLEKEMATHSSILAWKIPWMEKPGRLQSMGLQRVGHDWATSLHFTSLQDSLMLPAHFTANKTITLCLNCPENLNMSLDFWPNIILFIILCIKNVTYWVLVIEPPCFTNVKYGHITNMLCSLQTSLPLKPLDLPCLHFSSVDGVTVDFLNHQIFTSLKFVPPNLCSSFMTMAKEICSVMSDSATPRTVARQASLSMEFSLEYWSGLPFPSPGDLPDPGIKPRSPALQAVSILSVWYYSPCLDFILFCFLRTLLLFIISSFHFL